MRQRLASVWVLCILGTLAMLTLKNVFATYDKYEITEGSKIYSIKINMPSIDNSNIINEIKKVVNTKKEEIKSLASKNSKELIENKRQYELIVSSEVFEYNNIVSVHIALYSYTGGNHYIREDKMYHYNNITSEIIPSIYIENIIDLDKLSKIAYEKCIEILKERDVKSDIDYNWIEEGTRPNIENYMNWYLTKDGLNIIFTPYQIAPWSAGEIRIVAPYSQIQ